ncbi:MAG: hypothetical protein L7S59_04460 [Pseudomonadales bacterium]|nr:hypothetical protein [Pseudomonadales bacterium]
MKKILIPTFSAFLALSLAAPSSATFYDDYGDNNSSSDSALDKDNNEKFDIDLKDDPKDEWSTSDSKGGETDNKGSGWGKTGKPVYNPEHWPQYDLGKIMSAWLAPHFNEDKKIVNHKWKPLGIGLGNLFASIIHKWQQYKPSPPSEVPLPPSLLLFGSALLGLSLISRRRQPNSGANHVPEQNLHLTAA